MRLRNVKYAPELIAAHPDIIIANPEIIKGKWHECFENHNQIEIEIGCGKGKFITEMALRNPTKNFIGIEKFDSVIIRALEKVIENPIGNLRLIRMDAANINEVFDKGEVTRIYLNFSDPWPKKITAKRRLTSQEFLIRYSLVLAKNSEIIMKTDNQSLFDFSLEQLQEHDKFELKRVIKDLYQELPTDNIQTEFEQKFVEAGNQIYYLKATYKGASSANLLIDIKK